MLAMASAINRGDTAAMRAARAAADPNTIGREGMTLLTFAIQRRPETVPPLLRLGANPNLVAPGTLSPLAQALEAPDSTFAALLTSGADPNGPGDDESPILFKAIRGRLFDRYTALVAVGADVKRLDALGRTSLMAAAESGEWTIALDLLSRDVDIAHTASDGTTLRGILERQRPSRADEAAFRELIARVEERERLNGQAAPPRDSA
jgi:ankyrin repeat protein